MLSLPQLTSLSPNACKLYLLFRSLAQGRLITAKVADLATQAGFSLRTCRAALAELLSARLILRQPARYHSPCVYLLAPVSNAPSHQSKTDRQAATALPQTDRHTVAPLSPPIAQPDAPKPSRSNIVSPAPASPARQPVAAVLTRCVTATNPSVPPDPGDPLARLVDVLRQAPPEVRLQVWPSIAPPLQHYLASLGLAPHHVAAGP